MNRLIILILTVLALHLSLHAQHKTFFGTVRQQMEVIKKEYAVNFVYDASLKLDMLYSSTTLKGLGLQSALKELFRNTGIKWEVNGKHVLLSRIKKYTLSGYVYQSDGETVINATVRDLITGAGTLSNEHGFFSITLPEGHHTICFSSIGCGEHAEDVNLIRDTTLKIHLKDSYHLEEVLVTADLNSPLMTTQTGKVSLTTRDLNTGYALMSSPDVVKTLQNLPGVAAGTELVSGLYVHGGGNDENLFLLDGTPLYQVNHLGGLFSAFNTDIVKNIDFYKSGFPARYGGRLSSVVDVRTNDGNMKEYHGTVSIGLLDGRIQLEGPLKKDRTSFNIAMRRTWLDVITVPALAIRNSSKKDKLNMRYAFHDINAKITHRFSERSRADISLYSGNDVLKVNNKQFGTDYGTDYNREEDHIRFNLQWGNLTASLNWKYQFSPKLYSVFTGVYTHNRSRYDCLSEEKVLDEGQLSGITHSERKSRSTIDDVGYRMEFDYRPNPAHRLRMGSNYLMHFFRPQGTRTWDYSGNDLQKDTLSRQASGSYRGQEFSLYAEDDIALGSRLKLNAGLHYTLFHIADKTYHSIEPRASVRYQYSDRVTLKASYTEMSQFMHQLSNTYLNLPMDFWVPSTKKITPMRSRQYAVGVYMQLPFHIRLNMEGFYKTMNHIVEYDDGNSLTPSADDWEDKIHEGSGKAYGVEWETGYNNSHTSVSAAYTLSWSKRNFPTFYNGWYPDKFDNRHKLNLNLHHNFSSRIEAYASWSYHTGNRMTVPQQQVNAPVIPGIGGESASEWIYEQPNNVSLPAYHRLDLGVNFRSTTHRGHERIWNISVYNAYCRINPLYGKVQEMPDGSFKGKATGMFPILPSFSYTLKF
jgi:outer membrane receptor for ferrienterochelin and colicin